MSKYRDNILQLRNEGKTYKEICSVLGCSMSTVAYFTISSERERQIEKLKLLRETGKVYEGRKGYKFRNRQIVTEYLKTHPCVDCGNSDIRVLEFDHVRGIKLGNVSHGVHRTWSVRKLMDEINKCEIRCCNCHRIATIERRKVCQI
jgi:hypothetical protein